MKRYFSGLMALVIAIGAAAFTHEPLKKNSDPAFADYYFQFTGTRNSQENDRTKWTMLATQTLPAYTAISCPGSDYGCKLVATDTVHISGTPRPANVYVLTGTKTPTTGTGISSVDNSDLNP